MIQIPTKLKKYIPSGRYNLAALVEMVAAYLSDPQSSKSDWDSGEQFVMEVLTTTTSYIYAGDVATAPVVSTNGFTAASVARPAYVILTDGVNYEIVKYMNAVPAALTALTRGQYGTQARAWPIGTTVGQLTISHGTAPEYDLQPQPRDWWVNLSVSGGPPSQRVGHGWVYRPTDGCFYLFGGKDASNYLNDLWKFDPNSRTWTQLNPGGSAPGARVYASVVYAAAQDEIWVYGGLGTGPVYYEDTYKYSFSANSWTTDSAWNVSPGRQSAMCCYDKTNNKMIVAGGMRDYFGAQFMRETWAFDGSSWVRKAYIPDSNSGGYDGVAQGAGCWMSSEKRFFMVALGNRSNYVSLAYDPSSDSWETQTLPNPPSTKRRYPACCYDETSHRALVFGGETLSGGVAANDLWSFYYPSKTWSQLASFCFHYGDDKYSRHGFAWDSNNNQAVAWGGWSASAPTWHQYAAPIYFRHYFSAAMFRTQTMDVGETPNDKGVWKLEDVYDFLNNSNWIQYSAKYSDDGQNWTDAGVIKDGDPITQMKRYWRVKTQFAANGIEPPRVQKIDAVFDKKISFSMSSGGIGDAAPVVKRVGTLTSSIDPVKCSAQIGGVTIELIDANRIVADILASGRPAGKEIRVKVGLLEDDVGVGDFFPVFTGVVENWEYDGRALIITARDFLGNLEKDVPEENTDGTITPLVYNAAGIASHPVDILLDILRNRVNAPDRMLDLSGFENVKNDASISDWAFSRTISDPTDAYDACLDICRHIGAALIPREDGRISLKMLRNDEAPVAVWNEMEQNFGNANFNANVSSTRNYVSTWWHWDGEGDEWTNFEGAQVVTDAQSVADWGSQIIRTKSKWLGDNVAPYAGDQLALAISYRILGFAKEGLPILELETSFGAIEAQVGDVVRVQTAVASNETAYKEWLRTRNPSPNSPNGRYSAPYLAPECAECVDMLWWVTRKRIDVNRGTIKWELTRCRRTPLEKEFTTESDFSAGHGENIDLETNPGAVQLALESAGQYYTDGCYELIIDLGQQPERAGNWLFDTTIPSGAGLIFTAWASEIGMFFGEEFPLGTVTNADAVSVKTRFYKIRAALTATSNKTQTPAVNRIKVSFPV